jgi:hypothetical protein
MTTTDTRLGSPRRHEHLSKFTGLAPMAAALEAGFSDYVMLDPDRIGGVTGSRRAAGLASAYDRKVSSHFFPEVSAHAGGNTRTPLARIC